MEVALAGKSAEVRFAIYAESTGGVALWSELQTVNVGADGRYSVLLGATSHEGIPATIFPSGEARYLEAIPASAGSGDTQAATKTSRRLIAAVPYAYKAADADSLAGRSASDYLTREDLRQSLQAASTGGVSTQAATAVTGSGTANTLPLWTTAATLGNSLITQSGTNVGVSTATPATTLDVNGTATIRGSLALPSNGIASSATGYSSHGIEFTSSSYSSSSNAAVAQNFKFQAFPVGNNTVGPTANLELLFGLNSAALTPTGLAIAPNGRITFAPGQTFPGTGSGTITGVTAGMDLLGGGTSGNVTLSLDTTKVARLAAANTFTGLQTIASGDLALPATASSASGVLALGGIPFLHGYAAGKRNVFVGGAGNFTTTGSAETGVGANALLADSTGSDNTAVGAGALANNKTGSGNTAVGYNAGPDAASGGLNNTTAIGSGANVSRLNSMALGQNTVGTPGATYVNVGIGTAAPQTILEASLLNPGGLGPVLTLSNEAVSTSGASTAGTAAAINFLTRPGSFPTSQIMAADNGNNGDDISFKAITDEGPATVMVVSANNGVSIGNSLNVTGDGTLQGYTNGTTAIHASGGSFYAYPGGGAGTENPFTGGDGGDFIGGTGVTNSGGAGGRFFGGASSTSSIPSAVGGDGIFAQYGVASGSCPTPGSGCTLTLVNGKAATLVGDVSVSGTLTASTKDFKIDDPADPANRYLVHASVESSEMMNIYSGNVMTDELGLATIELPSWFETLNTDFRYQLTVIGQFAQAIVKDKIADHKFRIMTNQTHVEVSWQVTAVRHDAYAKSHPLVVEQDKPVYERGFYQNPELYGQPREKQTEWGRHPEQMASMTARRAGAAQTSLPGRALPGMDAKKPSVASPKQAGTTFKP